MKEITILLIEDDPADVQLIKEQFGEDADIKVDLRHVEYLSSAIRMLGDGPVDLILLDLGLPDSSGLTTLQNLRKRAVGTPIIVLTGLDDDDVGLRAVELGAEDFIVKGELTHDAFCRTVRYAMGRKDAQQARRESEEKFRGIFENSVDGIHMVDEEGKVIEWNRGNELITGLTVEQVQGRYIWDVLHGMIAPSERTPRLYKQLQTRTLRFLQTGKVTWQGLSNRYTILRPDGTTRVIESQVSPIRTDKGWRNCSIVRDVTEMIDAERAVRESEEKYRFLLDNLSDVIIEVDSEADFTYVSPQIEAVYGFTPEEVIGKSVWEFIHPDDVQGTVEKMQEAMEKGAVYEYEYRTRRKDGEYINVIGSGKIVHIGEDFKIVGVVRDITERTKAEMAIRESEEKFRLLFENAGEGIIYIDPDGIIRDLNPRVEEISGYGRDELVGKDFLNMVELFGLDPSRMEEAFGEMITGSDDQTIECPITNKSGEELILRAHQSLVEKDGELLGLTVIIEDITGRKEAEEALAAEAIRRRILIEQSRDGIVVLDQEGRVYESNQRFAEMLGFSPEEVSHLHVWDWEFQFTPEQVRDMLRTVDEAGDKFETQHRRKDGTIYDVEICTNAAVFAGEKLIFCVCRDTTERKKAEETLRRSRRDLARAQSVAKVGSWKAGLETGEWSWSDEVLRIMGIEAPPEDADILDLLVDIVHPDDIDGLMKAQMELVHSHKTTAREFRIRRPDGEVRYLWSEAQIILDEAGQPVEAVGTIQDITDRKRVETALLRQADNLALINEINDALNRGSSTGEVIGIFSERVGRIFRSERIAGPLVFILDESGECLKTWNIPSRAEGGTRTAHHMGPHRPHLTLSREDGALHFGLMEKGRVDVLNDAAGIEELFSELVNGLRTDEPTRSDVISRLSSELHDLHGARSLAVIPMFSGPDPVGLIMVPNSGPYSDEEVEGLGLISRQLTAAIFRKRAEQAMKVSEEKYRAVVENANEAILIAQDEYIKFHNPATLEMLGYSSEELSETPFIEFIHPDDREMVGTRYMKRIMGEDVPSTYSFRIVSKEGETIWVDLNVVFIEWEGRPATLNFLSDITDSRLAQEDLQASEEKFRELADLLPQTIFEIDLKGNFTYVNQGAFETFGYDQKDFHEGLNVISVIAEEDIERAMENIQLSMRGEKVKSQEYTGVRRDGSTFPVQIFSTPIIRDGEPAGLRGIVVDISDIKEAQTALKESEEKFRTVFENSPIGIAVMAPESQGIIEMNQVFTQMMGYGEGELKGMTLAQITHQEDYESEGNSMKNILSGADECFQSFTRESRYIRKDGEILWTITSATLVRDAEGMPRYAIAVIEDITDQKMAEKAILVEKNFTDSVINSLPGIFYMSDEYGSVVRWNDNLEAITGYAPEELSELNALDFFEGEDRQRIVDRVEEVFTQGKAWMEADFRCKDGRKVPYYLTGMRVTIDDVPYQVGIGTDITDRKRAEEKVRRLNEELEARVKERTLELEAANKELESFSYSVSHDLRAPLRSMDGFSQALLEDHGDRLDEDGKRYLQKVRNSSQKMATLIDDLLKLSRITRHDLMRTDVNLTEVARSILNELGGKEPERKVKTIIHETPIARGDPNLIRQALTNLLGNAWKFTGKKKKAVIEFGVDRDNGRDVYYVRDNGAGFDMKYAEKLFSPFQRLHAVEDFPGTGIGLAIVRRVFSRHGGDVWGQGESGKGTTFHFTLQPEVPKEAG